MQPAHLKLSSILASLIIMLTMAVAHASHPAPSGPPSGPFVSAPEALSEVEAGNMVLLDIRSPEEWKETGIASVALPVTMHNREFLQNFKKIVSDNPDKKIGIICATGGRTAWLQTELKKRGLGEVINVSEGMLGNEGGPGWIARGLTMKKIQ